MLTRCHSDWMQQPSKWVLPAPPPQVPERRLAEQLTFAACCDKVHTVDIADLCSCGRYCRKYPSHVRQSAFGIAANFSGPIIQGVGFGQNLFR